MPLPRIRVYLDATGPQSVMVNGEELVDRVAELGLKAPAGSPPELWLMQHGEIDIEGEGIVRVLVDDEEPSEVIVAFLDSIDPEELEAKALEDVALGDGSTTPKMLEILKGWARGTS